MARVSCGSIGRSDSRRFGAGGFVCARTSETQERAVRAALARVSEETPHVEGAAFGVSLRSYLPAPMYGYVRSSRKNETNEDARVASDEARWLGHRG